MTFGEADPTPGHPTPATLTPASLGIGNTPLFLFSDGRTPMTDDMDDWREQIRHLFSDRPPRDVVPGSGLDRETLKAQNDAADSIVTVTVPGELVEDVDGMPIAVGPSTTSTAMLGGPVISHRDVERLGLTPDELATEFPNVTVWSPTKKENDE